MTASMLGLVFCLALPGVDPETPRQPNPFAPSLPLLTEAEEEHLDHVIDRFILYDTGRLPGPEGVRARQEFEKLGPPAIPALIRGMNRAAAIDHSCPAVVIAKKLSRLLGTSSDVELLEYARENIGAGVTRSKHMSVLQDLRVMCMLRKAAVARQEAIASAARSAKLRTASTGELVEAAGQQRGQRLVEVLNELARREGEDVLGALGAGASVASDAETKRQAREILRRRLLGLSATDLRSLLGADHSEVRAMAARVIGEKRLPLGGDLIARLKDDDPWVQESAHFALVRLSRGQDFGPRRDASVSEREIAINRWESWWGRVGGR